MSGVESEEPFFRESAGASVAAQVTLLSVRLKPGPPRGWGAHGSLGKPIPLDGSPAGVSPFAH